MEIANRLKEARKNLGLTLEAVASRIQIAESTISDFENGKREPKLAQLKRFSEAYKCSISSFLDEQPISKLAVLWRERPEDAVAEELQATLLDLAKRFHALEVLTGQTVATSLPTPTHVVGDFSYPDAASLARHVRTELGLGDRPGQTLLRVLEEVSGVKIFHLEFHPTGCAACSVSEEFGTAVLLNSNNSRWRRNFDLAHELFHLLTWRVFGHHEQSGFSLATEKEEKLATCFARNLLMPVEVFKEAIELEKKKHGCINFDGLYAVAREFDVSVDAVMWHMSFVFNINGEKTKTYLDLIRPLMATLDTRKSEPVPSRPIRYITLCNEAIRKGLISTGRYAESLGISRREATQFIEQEVTDDVQIEVVSA